MKTLIAGGGVGGLALAQALRRDGFDVAVYERDATPEVRNQGYRIHIDADGNAALRDCLPDDVLDLVRRTSGATNDLVATYTPRLKRVWAQTFPPTDGEITHVDRNAFRRALLTGLGDAVRFGQTMAGYEVTGSGRVRVRLAGGGADEGDLLVGADGAGSVVRRQLLPHAAVRDLGLRCVYGRMPITEATEPLIPADFDRGFCWVADDDGCGVAFAPMRPRSSDGGVPPYIMIALVAQPHRIGVPDAGLFRLPARRLWALAVEGVTGWHPAVRELLAHADPESFFPVAVRAAETVGAWEPGPVTLLGDAIHAMPPTGGVGANTALRDAATLAGELRRAVGGGTRLAGDGGTLLADAVAAYERVMLPHGFATVEGALRTADQMFPAAA